MAHITDEQIKKYYAHMLRQPEETDMLTHIAKCEYCAGRFASGLPQTEMIGLPHGVSVEILEKAEKIPTKQRRRREYYRYCTRVALGMCMSFALLVTANLTYNSDSQSMPGTVLEEVQQDIGEKIGSETARKDLTAKKSAYEKKQSEMKKKQDTERKKFMEKHRESSGSRSFSINRVFRKLQKYLNIKK